MLANASTTATIQAPIVRHGWRLHALARRSVTDSSLDGQPARRNCSSSGTSASWNVWTASSLETTLSPCSSIFNRSRVTGWRGMPK